MAGTKFIRELEAGLGEWVLREGSNSEDWDTVVTFECPAVEIWCSSRETSSIQLAVSLQV